MTVSALEGAVAVRLSSAIPRIALVDCTTVYLGIAYKRYMKVFGDYTRLGRYPRSGIKCVAQAASFSTRGWQKGCSL
jgi:hypothetical protein